MLPLIAEGRGIGQRGLVIETPVPELDPRIAAYHEINGDMDSVCSTPPALSMNWLTRGEDHGALGPLTPHPLSPSILTLCGRPGLDDQFAFADPLGPRGLVDMRECESPRLPA
ncbi:hypothetical protein HYH03_009008 [Edaphochlamys debaryana]|uniref:Uncharacterized protein n=1 Tax=Edaphochlamys debaryana TaxID=47281 RepID=A0A835Y017_9CHLO|nr:hypothetical protein HYH03_009008 [Edaphochlamys debaryana]|eukprot:KAG2492854.1 hypothetical protein HYH03_009008 [Edaphochlamys debaryana]